MRGLLLSDSYPSQPHPNVHAAARRAIEHLPRYLCSPLHEPSVQAFTAASAWTEEQDPKGVRPLLLDSGCGTGRSTRMLALARPDALVIGIDRSDHRLRKGQRGAASSWSEEDIPNSLLVRAELATFWRLLLMESCDASPLRASRIHEHTLFYPNPYPKASRLNLRWHGHAALPLMLAINGTLEVRSNWRTYLVEFVEAMRAVATFGESKEQSNGSGHDAVQLAISGASRRLEIVHAASESSSESQEGAGDSDTCLIDRVHLAHEQEACTLFELKYHRAGEQLHKLWLPAPALAPVADSVATRLTEELRQASRGR